MSKEEEYEKYINTEKDLEYKKGVEQGIKQGIVQEKKTIVLNMLKNNVDVELISKYTGLSIDDIDNLK